MRIIKETESLMVLKDRRIFGFFVGVVFFFLGTILLIFPNISVDRVPFWLDLVFIICGAFAILFMNVITVTIDKNANSMHFISKSLFIKGENTYGLKDIKQIEMRANEDSTSSGRTGFYTPKYSYSIVFILSNDIPVVMPSSGTTIVAGVQIIPEKKLGARISAFLGVPFIEKKLPTLAESIGTIKEEISNSLEKI